MDLYPGLSPLTAKIGGTTVELEPNSFSATNTIGQRSQTSFTWHDYTGTIVDDGTVVEVYDPNNTLIYSGYIDTDTYYLATSQSSVLFHDATCKDNNYICDRLYPGMDFLNVYAGDVVTALYNAYLAKEGVTIGGIDQGVYLAQSLVYNYSKTLADIYQSLANQCGYWWMIDAQKRLWFKAYTGLPAPFVFDGTQADWDAAVPTVQYGNPEYRNQQIVLGGVSETSQQTESQYGDGKKQAFALRYQVSDPKDAKKFAITVNGVAQTVGTKGQDTGFQWYAATGDNVVAQDTSGTPLGVGDVLEVVYVGRYNSIAIAQSAKQIATRRTIEGGGTGIVTATYRDTKLKSLTDAYAIANAQLSHYGQSLATLTFTTQDYRLQQGMLLTCNWPAMLLNNKPMLVQTVQIKEQNDNLYYLVTAIGSPADITWQSFMQALANQADGVDPTALSSDTELTQIVDVPLNIGITGTVSVASRTPLVIPFTVGPSAIIGG